MPGAMLPKELHFPSPFITCLPFPLRTHFLAPYSIPRPALSPIHNIFCTAVVGREMVDQAREEVMEEHWGLRCMGRSDFGVGNGNGGVLVSEMRCWRCIPRY